MEEKVLTNSPIHYWTNAIRSDTGLVLLHPAFADHGCFDEQRTYFAERKLIFPDLLGHGASIGDGTIAQSAEWLAGIMEAEGLSRINLVGVSIGGVLAQDFANKYPEKIASLTCIGSYDINNFDPALQKENGREQMKMVLLGFLSIRKFAEANRKIGAYTSEGQERFYEMNLRFKKSSFRYLASLGSLINQHRSQPRDYPLMIGVGEHDRPFAVEASRRWAEHEPEARFVVFPGAGHIVNLDTPKRFNEALEGFLV